MTAPVFDPLSVGVDPVEASTEVLLALQAAYRQGESHGAKSGWIEGYKAGVELGHQQGFIEGADHGVSQGLIRAKEIIEKEIHRGE